MFSRVTFLTGVLSILSAIRQGAAVPSPGSVGSNLQILLHNDIYGNLSTRNANVIVLGTSKTNPEAAAACAALSEALWDPPNLSDDVFLPYLAYQTSPERGSSYGQMYFIAGGGPRGVCKAISPNGYIQYVSCYSKLPALCTQSAPLSGMYFEPNSTQYQTQVSSGDAVYTGFRDKLSFRFLGIRYAAQPERFTYSTLYEASGTQSALDFGQYCAQYGGGGEDCLFLNVWTPYLPNKGDRKAALKPVLMWIHGGAYINGKGSDPTFDGGNLASRGDVVVVTINYRLGALGFLTLNETGINGNYGIGDQVMALKWIQANIMNFGGDPNRVTVFGQSAGAGSTRALLQSPPATGLFTSAVLMSNPQGPLAGGPLYTTYLTPAEETYAQTNAILADTGCTTSSPSTQLACLRAYDPNALVTLPNLANNVVVDGTYVITNRLEWNGTGHVNSVPLMIGNMRDDGAPFFTYVETNSLAVSLADSGFPVAEVINSGLFPVPTGANATLNVYNTTARVSTDGQMRCGDQATAYAAAVTKTMPVTYYYEFNRSYQITYWDPNSPVCNAPIEPGFPYGNPSSEYFKCHSGELMYVFGTWPRWLLPARDALDIPFTQYIVDTWAAFARTHKPVPEIAFLEARGFTNTTREMQLGGYSPWVPVSKGKGGPTLRLLQWPSLQTGFGEQEQCAGLGFGLDYFL